QDARSVARLPRRPAATNQYRAAANWTVVAPLVSTRTTVQVLSRALVAQPLIIQAPHAQVDDRSRHPARLIGCHEDRHAGHLRERRQPARVGPAGERLLELFPGH